LRRQRSRVSGRALIYVYRENNLAAAAVGIQVLLNGGRVSTLNNRGYTWFYGPEGENQIGAAYPLGGATDRISFPVEWKAGAVYYYRLEAHIESAGYNTQYLVTSLRPIDPFQARREITEYRFQHSLDSQGS
jgi:hypothetical protein